jgi:multiple sugar transport system permease protein
VNASTAAPMDAPLARRTSALPRILIATAGIVMAGIVIGPILWGVMTSLKTEVGAVSYPPNIWPKPFTLVNFEQVFTGKSFRIELFNSLLYSLGSVALAILVAGPAGYAASRFTFPGKRAIMLVILVTAMIPAVALLAPTYFLLDRLGLVDNAFAIIVIFAARIAPQTVWFIQNFADGVAMGIDEAALIDGASRWQVMTRIVLPLIKPGIAATFVLGVITIWNDYITVATFAPDIGKRTLQVALVNQVFDAIGMSWSYFMAFAVIASVPVVAIFLVAQKWFVAGLTAGGLKG